MPTLEFQTKNTKGKGESKSVGAEDFPVPKVRIEADTFVLEDDVLQLLERAALEPLPPKDENGPQSRIKDESSGEEFNKDSVEHGERRLAELGRRAIEVSILDHFISKIEAAHKEAVAFEMQEELIREEEAARLAEVARRLSKV